MELSWSAVYPAEIIVWICQFTYQLDGGWEVSTDHLTKCLVTVTKGTQNKLECIHRILPRASLRYEHLCCQTCQIDSTYACIFFAHIVMLLTINTTCDFERGGTKKQIIGSSGNNGV